MLERNLPRKLELSYIFVYLQPTASRQAYSQAYSKIPNKKKLFSF